MHNIQNEIYKGKTNIRNYIYIISDRSGKNFFKIPYLHLYWNRLPPFFLNVREDKLRYHCIILIINYI